MTSEVEKPDFAALLEAAIGCPFCGLEHLFIGHWSTEDGEGYRVECLYCDALGPLKDGATAAEAVESWRQRAIVDLSDKY